jgi:ribosomal subunit interface protein
MELILKNRNGKFKISDRQRAHIHEKLGKLERYLGQARSITVEISEETRRHQKGEDIFRLQVTLVGEHGVILRADQSADDIYKAVDLVQDVLQRQIKRYKEKYWKRGKLRRKSGEMVSVPGMLESVTESIAEPEATVAMADPDTVSEEDRTIVRVKEFAIKPMFTDEAIEQMELLGHSFFVFRDADTSHISVVYRRKDGNYGMIVPEEG